MWPQAAATGVAAPGGEPGWGPTNAPLGGFATERVWPTVPAVVYIIGMAVETPVAPQKRTDHESKLARDHGWDVIVWDDPVNLMSYVVLVFRKLFGHDHETATKLMLQVHNEGRATVATQPREQAEISVAHLHAFGLQATLAKV